MTTETIELNFTYTEAEYVGAVHAYYARTFHAKTYLIAAGLLIMGGVGLWLASGEPVALFGLAVFTLIVGTPLIFYYITPGRHFRENPEFHHPYTLILAEEGLFFKGGGIESRLEWQTYQRAWENEQFYLLFYGKQLFTIIPKRVFADQAQEQQFRALVQRKMPVAWA